MWEAGLTEKSQKNKVFRHFGLDLHISWISMSKIHIDLFFMVIYVIFHKSRDIGTCFFAVAKLQEILRAGLTKTLKPSFKVGP